MDKIDWVREEAKKILKEKILNKKKSSYSTAEDDVKEVIENYLEGVVDALVKSQKTELSKDALVQLQDQIVSELFGFGSLEHLLDDPQISDIMINSPSQIFIEKKGEIIRLDIGFKGPSEILGILEKMMHGTSSRINQTDPFVDFKLKDGSRVTAMVPPVTKSPAICVRKFSHEDFDLKDLVEQGALCQKAADFLKACIKARLNILITGSTGAGKTTLLNVLMRLVPLNERMITIEDTEELSVPKSHHFLKLLTRQSNVEGKGEITIENLVKLSLHVRPDRIIIGEVRGEEAFYFLQAINTGHRGSMCTMHANDAEDALIRVETLGLMAKANIQAQVVKRFIGMGLDLVIHLMRDSKGQRLIAQIAEVTYKNDTCNIENIFHRQDIKKARKGSQDLVHTGKIPSFAEQLSYESGWNF